MIGVDIIKTSRMQKMLENFGEKALKKFLTDDEIKLVKNYKTAAGFWAVKEACSKALGTGIGRECSFYDIKISKTARGAPQIKLSDTLINKFLIGESSVSISHDGDYAIAVVALEKSLPPTNKI